MKKIIVILILIGAIYFAQKKFSETLVFNRVAEGDKYELYIEAPWSPKDGDTITYIFKRGPEEAGRWTFDYSCTMDLNKEDPVGFKYVSRILMPKPECINKSGEVINGVATLHPKGGGMGAIYSIKDNEFYGTYKLIYGDYNNLLKASYKDGKLNGAFIALDPAGRPMAKGRFKDSLLNGKYLSYNTFFGGFELHMDRKYNMGVIESETIHK